MPSDAASIDVTYGSARIVSAQAVRSRRLPRDARSASAVHTAGWIALATPLAMRALVSIVMFDAVNASDRRYRQFLVELLAAATTSREATAAAAATMLSTLHPEASSDIETMLTSYLSSIADGQPKAEGVKVGEMVPNRVLPACESDGATALDAHRPNTKPGAYIPTPVTIGWALAAMKPFVLATPSQYRPGVLPHSTAKWVADS